MNKLNKFFNQRGMSLINVIIGIALTSVMALGVMRLMKTSTQAQQGMKSSSDFTNVTNEIQSRLLRRDYCRLSFADGSYALPEDPNLETVVAVPNLVRPVYTVDASGIRTISETVNEYVLPPPATIDPDDPLTGLQFGEVSLMSMNLIRPPASDELFLELNFLKRGAQAFGGKNLSKRIRLQAIYATDGSGTIRDCFSDFENLASSAIESTCIDALGGAYNFDGDPNTPDCTICDRRKQILMNEGSDVTEVICGVTFTIQDGPSSGLITSGNSHTLPDNYVRGTLRVTLVGGGGGGGCGSTLQGYGEGGGRASVNRSVPHASNLVAPGTVINYTIGSAGSGSSANPSCNSSGSNGGTTSITIDGVPYSASGGDGGKNEAGGDSGHRGGDGQGVYFAGTSYSGGSRGDNSPGGAGQIGSGGGGGRAQSPLHVKHSGGNGGSGAIWLRYKVWTETP